MLLRNYFCKIGLLSTPWSSATPRRNSKFQCFRPETLEQRQLLSASGISEPQAELLATSSPQQVHSPIDVRRAYGIDGLRFNGMYAADGSGQTVAIIIGGHHPYMGRDLGAFDRQWGLPDPSVSYMYSAGYRPSVATQTIEGEMDVELAHAMAPGANILLVEAPSLQLSDLFQAIDVARHISSVSVISMSWAISEGNVTASQLRQLDGYFQTPAGHRGITFIASSGDDGAWDKQGHVNVNYPASSPNVLAAGGTSLYTNTNGSRYWEGTWSGSGGGYSHFFAEPQFQGAVQRSGWRTVPDVSWDADPNTGVWVAYTPANSSQMRWTSAGGTSASAPSLAGFFAIVDEGRAIGSRDSLRNTPAVMYALPQSDFYDITAGGNGYSATNGYDLATGRGTPIGLNMIRDLVNTDVYQATARSSAAPMTAAQSVSSWSVMNANFVEQRTANPGSPAAALAVQDLTTSQSNTSVRTAALAAARTELPPRASVPSRQALDAFWSASLPDELLTNDMRKSSDFTCGGHAAGQ